MSGRASDHVRQGGRRAKQLFRGTTLMAVHLLLDPTTIDDGFVIALFLR
jgi:hypothetical protein